MSQLPPAVVQAAAAWLREADAALPGFVTAFYVVGSAALGTFDTRHSDIDFVAVVAARPDAAQTAALERAHRRAQRSLDGRLVTEAALRGNDEGFAFPVFRDGHLLGPAPWRVDSLDAHVLREYGVALRGQAPTALAPPCDWNVLDTQMVENLNSYWRRWRQDSARIWTAKGVGLLLGSQVEWGVLGVSRIIYSLSEHAVISKAGAGQYMLGIAPERWHAILREALRPRLGGLAQFSSPWDRRREALAYIDWVIEWANESKCLKKKG